MGSEYRIQAITFGEEWVEITYMEERLMSKDVVDITSRLINPSLFRDEIFSIIEDVEDLLDRAHIHRRNPRPPAYPPAIEMPGPAPEAPEVQP